MVYANGKDFNGRLSDGNYTIKESFFKINVQIKQVVLKKKRNSNNHK